MKLSSLSYFHAIILLLIITGCSVFSTEQNQEIILRNNTENPIIYAAWDLESSHLVDLYFRPYVVQPDNERLVLAGESVSVSRGTIGGFQVGNDVRFFLSVVKEDTARYNNFVTLRSTYIQFGFPLVIIKGEDGRLAASK